LKKGDEKMKRIFVPDFNDIARKILKGLLDGKSQTEICELINLELGDYFYLMDELKGYGFVDGFTIREFTGRATPVMTYINDEITVTQVGKDYLNNENYNIRIRKITP
jgi:hypothetical protein